MSDEVKREAAHHFTKLMEKITTKDEAEIAEAASYLGELARTSPHMHDLVVHLVEIKTGISWDTFK
jgi:hypothetical protein